MAAAVGVGLLAVYAVCACRTVYVGDSGELVAAVYTLGIPHPSGYPLYVLLGKLWTLLVPVGSVALRMSLFSGAAAAAAAAWLYLLCRRQGFDREAALLAALLLGFGPSLWSQATIQRVYCLNALFVVAAADLALRWHVDRRRGQLVTTLFLCGLGATNHTFMGVMGMAVTLWALLDEPGLLRQSRTLIFGAAAFAFGLLPYLFLPLRSRANPRLDWGDPETLRRFLDVVVRREYWERAWVEGPTDLVAVGANYLASFAVELAWGGAALALAALVLRRAHRVPLLLPLLLMAGNLAIMAAHGSHADLFLWHRYYLPSYAMAALLAGAGAVVLIRHLPRHAGWALLLLPAALAVNGFPTFDRSRHRLADDFAHRVLASCVPGAHLVASDDNVLFSLLYLQLVEGVRPDVHLVAQGVGAELPPLHFLPENDPLYFTHHPNWNMPFLSVVPVGVVYRIWRPERPPPQPVVAGWWLDGERDPAVPRDDLTCYLLGHFHFMLAVTFEASDWLVAREQLCLALQVAPEHDVLLYNVGLVLRRNGLYGEARDLFLRAHRVNPRCLQSQGRPRAMDRVRELETEIARLDRVEAALRAADPALAVARTGTADYHSVLATRLADLGEPLAARGHRLRAMELQASPAPH